MVGIGGALTDSAAETFSKLPAAAQEELLTFQRGSQPYVALMDLLHQAGVEPRRVHAISSISEAYRHPEHKVLNQGEFVVVSDPLTHGAYSDRGGIDSQPIDTTTEHVLGRGWVLAESFSLAIANSRSAAVGIRV
jgi:hypothetical protein